MIDLCKNLGYRHETLASDKGEFAYRGGIIDIFPLSSPEPCRIEFWGEKIISIRPFNPSDQLSTGKVSKLSISPATKDSGPKFYHTAYWIILIHPQHFSSII